MSFNIGLICLLCSSVRTCFSVRSNCWTYASRNFDARNLVLCRRDGRRICIISISLTAHRFIDRNVILLVLKYCELWPSTNKFLFVNTVKIIIILYFFNFKWKYFRIWGHRLSSKHYNIVKSLVVLNSNISAHCAIRLIHLQYCIMKHAGTINRLQPSHVRVINSNSYSYLII